jgi:hypothetical protein
MLKMQMLQLMRLLMICIIVEVDNEDAAVDIDFHAVVDDFNDFDTDDVYWLLIMIFILFII